MTIPTTYLSGFTTSINGADRTLVDPHETIGRPNDAPATDINAENSLFALLKGCLVELGMPAGSGDANTIGGARNKVHNPVQTLGDVSDAPADSPADAASAVALTKSALRRAGL